MEYSPSLRKVAEKNIEIFRKRTNTRTQFEVVHSDARSYPIPDEAAVFFLFHPFGEEVLVPVLARIHKSVMRSLRAAHVVYVNPRSAQAADPKKFRRVLVIGEGRKVSDALVFELANEQTP